MDVRLPQCWKFVYLYWVTVGKSNYIYNNGSFISCHRRWCFVIHRISRWYDVSTRTDGNERSISSLDFPEIVFNVHTPPRVYPGTEIVSVDAIEKVFVVLILNLHVVMGRIHFTGDMLLINSSDAGDGIIRLWWSIPCLLMHWLLKSPVHQQAWYWLCRTDNISTYSRVISSTWGQPNPRYDSKCEYIYYNIQNNSACLELINYSNGVFACWFSINSLCGICRFLQSQIQLFIEYECYSTKRGDYMHMIWCIQVTVRTKTHYWNALNINTRTL